MPWGCTSEAVDKGEHIEAALKEVYGGAKAEAQKTRGDPVWKCFEYST